MACHISDGSYHRYDDWPPHLLTHTAQFGSQMVPTFVLFWQVAWLYFISSNFDYVTWLNSTISLILVILVFPQLLSNHQILMIVHRRCYLFSLGDGMGTFKGGGRWREEGKQIRIFWKFRGNLTPTGAPPLIVYKERHGYWRERVVYRARR